MRCSALRGLTGYEFSVITAVEFQPAGEWPAFCRVIGQIQPEIKFEVALPATWNQRLYMYGNGGYAGENLEAPNRGSRRDQALKLGFATAATNTGHDAAQEPLGTFAVNSQKLLDYAFRSLHVTAVTAKKLAEAYYGVEPRRSYFNGCSTGGRQGLILAQRFPQDFDGIVVGMPVLDFTGTMLRYVATQRALSEAPIPVSKVKLLASRIYEQCDGKDGLKDGLLDDPRRCDFVPSRHLPVCQGAESWDCFTAGQIRTLEVIYNDVTSQGKRLFPGWPVGPEIDGPNGRPGWENWFVREQGQTISAAFAETFFRYLAFPKKDPNFTIAQFDMEKDPEKLDWIRGALDATDPDLTAYRDRGGRILMYYGWADQALNPRMGVEYYEAVRQKMGAGTGGFFKLYMMPGVFHCGGGVGPASFDPLNPLINWVENNQPPESLRAEQVAGGKVVRSRPLCPYPQVAKYKGSGSADEAENFTCAESR
ncbi:MAG: tannase/feruloyl esterase family alpha/beta hydrolase [Bryobacteraceae bacterium]|nr:tannase/feruloyl esterase family alpha/beta hydrolase [Bryobacteraceae bacterium]